MKREVPHLEEMAQLLLTELQAGTEVTLDVTSHDAASGNLLLLLLALHQTAQERRVGVVVEQVSDNTIRLQVPGEV